jgi:hypothetical protein
MQRFHGMSSLLTGISVRRLTAGGITTCPDCLSNLAGWSRRTLEQKSV